MLVREEKLFIDVSKESFISHVLYGLFKNENLNFLIWNLDTTRCQVGLPSDEFGSSLSDAHLEPFQCIYIRDMLSLQRHHFDHTKRHHLL